MPGPRLSASPATRVRSPVEVRPLSLTGTWAGVRSACGDLPLASPSPRLMLFPVCPNPSGCTDAVSKLASSPRNSTFLHAISSFHGLATKHGAPFSSLFPSNRVAPSSVEGPVCYSCSAGRMRSARCPDLSLTRSSSRFSAAQCSFPRP
eukprot:1622017-Lingulodinium_polyedra.AAC.1